MAFHDVRLPDTVSQGAQGGPTFDTSIFEMTTGIEKRNQNWENSRGFWDVSYGLREKTDVDVLRDFFFARQGRQNSFRFKDWSDFEIGNSASSIPQTIATGDNSSTVFIATKVYKSGPTTHTRRLTKLVVGTVRAFLDGVEQFAGFVATEEEATITFTVPPGVGVVIGIIAEFDVHARFDIDELTIDMEQFDYGSVPNIPLIEIRETIVVTQTELFIDVTDAVTLAEIIPTLEFMFTVAINVEDAVTIGEVSSLGGIALCIFTSVFPEDITVQEAVTVTLV